MSIRIILADDHTIVLNGLRSLIEKENDMEVVAEAKDGRTAVQLALEHSPQVVIMDIAMPELNGIEATRQIIAAALQIKVIALSMHADKRYIMEMLKAGASGYLLKDSAFEELVAAIREVVVGNNTFLSPPIYSLINGESGYTQQNEEAPVVTILTPREREVLKLIAEGRSTAQIAADMDISMKTVETHRQHIMDKLNIRGIAELTRYAIRQGITRL